MSVLGTELEPRGGLKGRLVWFSAVRDMLAAQQSLLKRLDTAYRVHYDPVEIRQGSGALVAQYDYRRTDQAYILTKKATIWSAETNEHVFVFSVSELTGPLWRSCRELALRCGLERIHPHSDHQCSFVTAVVICDRASPEALDELARARYRKDYRFGFYGWMEFRAAAVSLQDALVTVNRAGREMRPFLEQNLNLTSKEKQP
ncbi:MAG TPA: hypothetical protein DCZ56_01885 [Sutterella sp.]|nr:hypothetical protein [Sutterella sp.]